MRGRPRKAADGLWFGSLATAAEGLRESASPDIAPDAEGVLPDGSPKERVVMTARYHVRVPCYARHR